MSLERLTQHTRDQALHQNENNKLRKQHDTPAFLEAFIVEEYFELLEEIELDRNIAFLVASEIGDILYLALRYEQLTGELTPDIEFAVQEAIEIADLVGLDPNHCVIMKILRNDIKYTQMVHNNGFNYTEAALISKLMYSNMGGDATFSHLWEQHGEQITHDEPVS